MRKRLHNVMVEVIATWWRSHIVPCNGEVAVSRHELLIREGHVAKGCKVILQDEGGLM